MSLRKFLAALCCVAAVSVAYMVSCRNASHVTTSVITELSAPLDSIFGTLFPDSKAPGAVVMVRRGDSIYYNRAFGMARLDSNLAMTDSTLLNVASASKTFTAIGWPCFSREKQGHRAV